MPTEHSPSKVTFKSKPIKIGDWILIRLPEKASAKLPSRGQVVVEGTINNLPFKTPLEPDGKGSHWFRVDKSLPKAAHITLSHPVQLSISSTKQWPEPLLPADLKKALQGDDKVYAIWQDITPMARWEWVRWVRSTSSAETRQKRIEVACAKMKAGKRRPCCWNRNLCTEPSISKNGVLLSGSE